MLFRSCCDAGMNFFLPKPIDPPKLMEVVMQALEAANAGADAQDQAAA